MFQAVNKLKLDIVSYVQYKIISNEHIITVNKSALILHHLLTGERLRDLQFERDIYEIIPVDDNEVIVYMGEKSKRFNLTGWKEINDAEFESLRINPISAYKYLVLVWIQDSIDSDKSVRGLYDIEQKRIIWESELLINPILLDGFLFSNGYTKIEHFDLHTGKLLWSQSIAEPGRYYEGKLKYDRKTYHGEVDSFLGVYMGILWTVLKNGLLIGMDIESGKVLHKIGAPAQYPAEATLFEEQRSMNYFFHRNSLLDKEKGKIMRLFRAGYSDNCFNWYFETDLNVAEPQLSITKVENATDIPFEIDGNPCPVWPFDNDFIYVCNYREYKIALFNRKTKKIDWMHQMEVEAAKRTFIIQMQVQDNRWYILDNTKTLYVYERQVGSCW